MRKPRAPRKGERGSATVLNLVIIAGVLFLLGVILGGMSQLAAKSQAGALADLAALAAAQNGSCEAAESVSARNPRFSLKVVRCQIDGLYAQVEIGREFPFAVRATSRAGPHW